MTIKKATLVLEGGATRGIFTSGALDYLIERSVFFGCDRRFGGLVQCGGLCFAAAGKNERLYDTD
jgi:hypothetical protein